MRRVIRFAARLVAGNGCRRSCVDRIYWAGKFLRVRLAYQPVDGNREEVRIGGKLRPIAKGPAHGLDHVMPLLGRSLAAELRRKCLEDVQHLDQRYTAARGG